MTTSRRPTKTEGRLDFEVNQVSHGFSVGTPIYHNGTSYVASSAASTTTGEVIAVVSEVQDTDNFTALPAGKLRNLSGLTAGSVYFLSETAGQVTTTAPTISKPVYFAVSTTEAVILPYRGGTGAGTLTFDGLTDTNFTSLADGQIATYDNATSKWINSTPSGGGDLVLLASTTVGSPVASVDFTSLIDGTYENYLVIFRAEVATDNVNFSMRTSSNNGSTYDSGASDYNFSSITSAGNQTSGARSDIIFNYTGVGNAAGEAIGGVVYISSPSQTKYCQIWGETRYTSHISSPVTVMFGAARTSTSSVNAIQFFTSSGNIATGTFKLYGIT